MAHFDHILNWTLKVGSHPFPGKDGGTCINEAAIVAAGFPYQPVRRVKDMPECFSRPICRWAMELNDDATDEQRQQLLPFVTRLACADTPEVEDERAAYIDSHLTLSLSFDKCITFEEGLKILEGALAIGRQADPLGVDSVKPRLDAVRSRAITPTLVPHTSLLSKIKKWFGTAKQIEPAQYAAMLS